MRKLKNESWPIEILSMKGLRGPSPLSFWCRRVINVVVVSSMSVILS